MTTWQLVIGTYQLCGVLLLVRRDKRTTNSTLMGFCFLHDTHDLFLDVTDGKILHPMNPEWPRANIVYDQVLAENPSIL